MYNTHEMTGEYMITCTVYEMNSYEFSVIGATGVCTGIAKVMGLLFKALFATVFKSCCVNAMTSFSLMLRLQFDKHDH